MHQKYPFFAENQITWNMTRAPSQKKPSMTYTAVWYGKTLKKIVKNQDNVWKIYKDKNYLAEVTCFLGRIFSCRSFENHQIISLYKYFDPKKHFSS